MQRSRQQPAKTALAGSVQDSLNGPKLLRAHGRSTSCAIASGGDDEQVKIIVQRFARAAQSFLEVIVDGILTKASKGGGKLHSLRHQLKYGERQSPGDSLTVFCLRERATTFMTPARNAPRR